MRRGLWAICHRSCAPAPIRALRRRLSSSPSPPPSSSPDPVETVFSYLVSAKVSQGPARDALLDLKRSLHSAKDSSHAIDALLSRNSSWILHRPRQWFLLLDLLRTGAHPSLALKAFEWKKKQSSASFSPEEYALVLRLAGRMGKLQLVKDLYSEMQDRGVAKTIEVENAYMFAHAYDTQHHDCKEALKVFERLRELKKGSHLKPDMVSYNLALSCYSKLKHLQFLETTFEEMVGEGYSPSVETYNCIMLAYRRLGMWWRMEEIFCMMREALKKPNSLTFSTLIRGYASAGLLDRMESVYEEMLRRNIPLRSTTGEAMVSAYKKAKEFSKMENVLFSIRAKHSLSSLRKLMVQNHASNDRIPEMERLVDEAIRNADIPCSPDLAVIVLKAYFKKGQHERLEGFMTKAESCGWNLNHAVYNTVIYLYGKDCLYDEMERYFQRMKASKCQPNLRTYQIMLRSYRKSGREDAAQDVSCRMKAAGFDS